MATESVIMRRERRGFEKRDLGQQSRGRSSCDQRGVTRSVELAVLLPALLAAIFMVIVVAVTMHGRSVAQQAAMVGAEHAAFYGAQPEQGRFVAGEIAQRGGLQDLDVQLEVEGAMVTIRVTAWVPNPLGRSFGRVSESSVRVREAG